MNNRDNLDRFIEASRVSNARKIVVDSNGTIRRTSFPSSKKVRNEIHILLTALKSPATNDFQRMLRSFYQDNLNLNLTDLQNAEIAWETQWRSTDGLDIFVKSKDNPYWSSNVNRYKRLCPPPPRTPSPLSI